MTEPQSIGEIFREGRAEKGATTSEVAAATRIKVQTVEAMENDDFSDIAAPAYAKGFIRLYAQYLGIDPRPLVKEYLEKHVESERSPLMPDTAQRFNNDSGGSRLIGDLAAKLRNIPRERLVQGLAILLGLLIALVAIALVGRKTRSCEGEQVKPPVNDATEQHRLLEEPPDPYL